MGCSSVGSSERLLIAWSQVRALPSQFYSIIMECPTCGDELYLVHRMTTENGHFRNLDRLAEEVDKYVLKCDSCTYIQQQ